MTAKEAQQIYLEQCCKLDDAWDTYMDTLPEAACAEYFIQEDRVKQARQAWRTACAEAEKAGSF